MSDMSDDSDEASSDDTYELMSVVSGSSGEQSAPPPPEIPLSNECPVSLDDDCIYRMLWLCEMGPTPRYFIHVFAAFRFSRIHARNCTRAMFGRIGLTQSNVLSFTHIVQSPLCTFLSICDNLQWVTIPYVVDGYDCANLLAIVVNRLPEIQRLDMSGSSFPYSFCNILQPWRLTHFNYSSMRGQFPAVVDFAACIPTLKSLAIECERWDMPIEDPSFICISPENIEFLHLQGLGMEAILVWLSMHPIERCVRPSEVVLSDVRVDYLPLIGGFLERAKDSVKILTFMSEGDPAVTVEPFLEHMPFPQMTCLESLTIRPTGLSSMEDLVAVLSITPPTLNIFEFYTKRRDDTNTDPWTALDDALCEDHNRFPRLDFVLAHTKLDLPELRRRMPNCEQVLAVLIYLYTHKE
ncbi:hypothetical protein FISHEDRAFT_56506 [Fistulina hepatica ATCC 64428]|uniref:F-box domain-containing protein n=1 Tax=Fistulina hepatica ATCC 64428 TaxID=1128425 RepID=A0A0D7AI89_9AGAR|nr:hypothetical protein FISHEDRAFT_56506 [Fistulina hepatica ATCC 64428]